MIKLWHRLFLEDRPSIGLSFFRIAAALTTILHVLPTLVHLDENYFPTAFKTYNVNFFTIGFLETVQKSPEWLIVTFVGIFVIFSFLFLIGLWSQVSCVLMVMSCYYFYALNSFHVGTLSWDILLVTLFLMCITDHHGDYFSVDALLRQDPESFKKKRPVFIQRLLQMQVGFTFFYTALYKVSASGNWLHDNPIYYLMNYPAAGVTKTFLLREFIIDKPQLCYLLGILILSVEFLFIFLLFWRKTRISAIYLGIFFHITLILTLDVPAIFFFLFPAQLLLFINSKDIVRWVENRRDVHAVSSRRIKLIYDGHCQLCLSSMRSLRVMDLFALLEMIDAQTLSDPALLHPQMTKEDLRSQICLIDSSGSLFKGFEVFRFLACRLPMMFPLIPAFYFPGMGVLGPIIYKLIAKNRYLLHWAVLCKDNSCLR